jgi:hypothetical protein
MGTPSTVAYMPSTASGHSQRSLLSDDADELLPTTSAGARPSASAAPQEDALVIQLGTKLRAGVRFFVVD